jgi:putative transposase
MHRVQDWQVRFENTCRYVKQESEVLNDHLKVISEDIDTVPMEWVRKIRTSCKLRFLPLGSPMRKSHFSVEQIVKIVRESHPEGVSETAKKYKVSENSIDIWRKKFGTMEPNPVSELMRIMQENSRLQIPVHLHSLVP